MRGNGIQRDWTAASETRLRYLHGLGWSAREIAADIGVSRNAVIGKRHRMGLSDPSRKTYSGRRKFDRERKAIGPRIPKPKRRKVSVAKLKLPPPPPPEAPEPKRLDLLELTDKTCKWPIGDPQSDDFHFCGVDIKPEEGQQPYCPYHRDLGTAKSGTPRTQKQKAAMRRWQLTRLGTSREYLQQLDEEQA